MCSLLGERCVSACKIDPVTGVIGRRGGRVLRDYALRPRDFMRAAAPARWPVHNMTRATKPSRTMSRYASRTAERVDVTRLDCMTAVRLGISKCWPADRHLDATANDIALGREYEGVANASCRGRSSRRWNGRVAPGAVVPGLRGEGVGSPS